MSDLEGHNSLSLTEPPLRFCVCVFCTYYTHVPAHKSAINTIIVKVRLIGPMCRTHTDSCWYPLGKGGWGMRGGEGEREGGGGAGLSHFKRYQIFICLNQILRLQYLTETKKKLRRTIKGTKLDSFKQNIFIPRRSIN